MGILIAITILVDIRIFGMPVILVLSRDEWNEFVQRMNQVIFWVAIWALVFKAIKSINETKKIALKRLSSFPISKRAHTALTIVLFISLLLTTILFLLRAEHVFFDILR